MDLLHLDQAHRLRWSIWRTEQKTNKMIEDYSRSQDRVQFIDGSTAMLDAPGKPRHELFRWDGLHMNTQGYSLWTLIPSGGTSEPVRADAPIVVGPKGKCSC
jgi:hypothetical protein